MPASAPSPVARFHQMPSSSAGSSVLAASEKDAPVMASMVSGAASAAQAGEPGDQHERGLRRADAQLGRGGAMHALIIDVVRERVGDREGEPAADGEQRRDRADGGEAEREDRRHIG